MVTGDLRLEKENICLEKEAGKIWRRRQENKRKMSEAVRRKIFSPSIKRKKRRKRKNSFGEGHSMV